MGELLNYIYVCSPQLLSFILCKFKFKAIFINIYAVIYFVKLYHAGTVCARRRARLLVMFRSDRGLETDCQGTLN